MKVITSQDFLDYELVGNKIETMEEQNITKIILPVIDSGLTNEDGEELYILIDGHHRYAAAQDLEIEVEFEEVEDDTEPGEERASAWYMGGDWRYLDSGCFVF